MICFFVRTCPHCRPSSQAYDAAGVCPPPPSRVGKVALPSSLPRLGKQFMSFSPIVLHTVLYALGPEQPQFRWLTIHCHRARPRNISDLIQLSFLTLLWPKNLPGHTYSPNVTQCDTRSGCPQRAPHYPRACELGQTHLACHYGKAVLSVTSLNLLVQL